MLQADQVSPGHVANPADIGASLTIEDLQDLLGAFFRSRNRVGNISISVRAHRTDTYSLLERFDFEDASKA